MTEQERNLRMLDTMRMFGGNWLLHQIGENIGLRSNLMSLFTYESKVNTWLSLTYFMLEVGGSLDRMERLQEVYDFPIDEKLSSQTISSFLGHFTDTQRLEFLSIASRDLMKGENLVACISVYHTVNEDWPILDKELGDIDGYAPEFISEVTVYTSSGAMPVYYKPFPKYVNEDQIRDLITHELQEIGYRDDTLVFASDDAKEYRQIRSDHFEDDHDWRNVFYYGYDERNWRPSTDGNAFLRYICRILSCTLRSAWRESVPLQADFECPLSMVDHMNTIQTMYDFEHGKTLITSFRKEHIALCKELGVTPPKSFITSWPNLIEVPL